MAHMPRPANTVQRPRLSNQRVFETAEDVLVAYDEFKEWCEENRIPIGSKKRTIATPMSITKFADFCNCGRRTLFDMKSRPDIGPALERVYDLINDSLIEQGMVRSLDGNLVARATGLADRQKVDTVVTEANPDDLYNMDFLDDDELTELTRLLTKASINKEELTE